LRCKSSRTLLLASLVLCLVTFSCIGHAAVIPTSSLATNSPYHYVDSGNYALFSQRGPVPPDENASLRNTHVDRVISVGDYGLVTVTDTVNVTNVGSSVATSWVFYLQPDVFGKLTYIAASAGGTSLDVVAAQTFSSFIGMKVRLVGLPSGGLAPGASIEISLVQEFYGLVRISSGSLALYYYKFIVSPYFTTMHSTTLKAPSVATAFPGGSVSPFNSTLLGTSSDGGYTITATTSLIDVISIDRSVVLDIGGYLTTTETHHVKNLGPNSLQIINFTIPITEINASLEVRDNSGKLPATVVGNLVTAQFPYPVPENSTYTYQVTYKTLTVDYRTVEGGLEVITMSPVTVYGGIVDLETVSVTLTPDAILFSAGPAANHYTVTSGNSIVISFTFRNVTILNTGNIEFRFAESLAQTLARPILFTLGVYIIGIIYVAIRRLRRKAAPGGVKREGIAKERELAGAIKDFCTDYEEKVAITLEIEELGKDRSKGRVSKRAYVERMNVARRRLAMLMNRLSEQKVKISAVSRRYTTMIKQLDTYDEERESARASLDNLEFRRRQGKVSGDVYNRLKYDITKKIEKATSGIDRTIVELRQEAV